MKFTAAQILLNVSPMRALVKWWPRLLPKAHKKPPCAFCPTESRTSWFLPKTCFSVQGPWSYAIQEKAPTFSWCSTGGFALAIPVRMFCTQRTSRTTDWSATNYTKLDDWPVDVWSLLSHMNGHPLTVSKWPVQGCRCFLSGHLSDIIMYDPYA